MNGSLRVNTNKLLLLLLWHSNWTTAAVLLLILNNFSWEIEIQVGFKNVLLLMNSRSKDEFWTNKTLPIPEAVAQRYSIKKLLLKISQNSQNTCGRAFHFLKKRHWHTCFPVNFGAFLRILVGYFCDASQSNKNITFQWVLFMSQNNFSKYIYISNYKNAIQGHWRDGFKAIAELILVIFSKCRFFYEGFWFIFLKKITDAMSSVLK